MQSAECTPCRVYQNPEHESSISRDDTTRKKLWHAFLFCLSIFLLTSSSRCLIPINFGRNKNKRCDCCCYCCRCCSNPNKNIKIKPMKLIAANVMKTNDKIGYCIDNFIYLQILFDFRCCCAKE